MTQFSVAAVRHESVLQRDVKDTTRKVGITKPASCHTLRSFATHLLTTTTTIYTHVLNMGGLGVKSPLDR